VHLRYFAIGSGGRIICENGGVHGVVAPLFFFDIRIDNREVHFAGYDLGAFEYGCVLVEEFGPVGVFGHRGLIGNEHGGGEVVSVCDHFFECGLHGYHAGAEAAAHAEHQGFKIFALERMVNHIQLLLAKDGKRVAGPLPIAKMPHDEYDAFAFIGIFLKYGEAIRIEFATFEHCFFADGGDLQYFEDKIAEIVVE